MQICKHIAVTTPISRLITLPKAAELLGISRSSLYRLIHKKQCPPVIVINNRMKGWREDEFNIFLHQLI
ncbi:helix-turn-helix transcriptional regulator [Photobacterium damselae]|uniref:helix-turn-helix transcriptional regulator n=1 Tax=Photobacterium damselae TaxID=38293 RepID=UPI0039C35D1A